MNSEIPPSMTIAPIAMISAELPLKPLPLPAVGVDVTVGVTVVVEGVETLCCGKPGDSGLVVCTGDTGVVFCASATEGSAKAAPRAMTTTTRRILTPLPRRYASGCSIAGVSGASTYGCSSATSSSWYTLSAFTAQMSWSEPVRMLSTARIAVSIE